MRGRELKERQNRGQSERGEERRSDSACGMTAPCREGGTVSPGGVLALGQVLLMEVGALAGEAVSASGMVHSLPVSLPPGVQASWPPLLDRVVWTLSVDGAPRGHLLSNRNPCQGHCEV